ncbi:MAG: SDR family oxidoreductase [Candidatus Gorgyraea atricola]|nr:SDR family oxidoreductase [Candidatus Gorgyraea atricola]
MKNIFITGATGFLGWDIVKNLLKKQDSKLYLLVRGNSDMKAKDRITKLINKSYDKAKRDGINERIEVVHGDTTKKDMGIKKFTLDKLRKEIETIYHCAALCEFGMPLEPIRKINVLGTKNVLDFALQCNENNQFDSFHHISTVAVVGKFGGIFYEDSLDVGQGFNNTYEETKFEAEKLIAEYRHKGLSISIYRPSIITGDSKTGEVSNFQMFYQPLHIFSLGIFDEIPADRTLGYNLVPIDYVAQAIYLISSEKENNNRNYHLTNPNTIALDFLLEMASSYFGFQKPKLTLQQKFHFEDLKGFRRKVIEPYLPYFNHRTVIFDAENFDAAINGKEFRWPVIDKDLLSRLFKYCADVKYIRRKA